MTNYTFFQSMPVSDAIHDFQYSDVVRFVEETSSGPIDQKFYSDDIVSFEPYYGDWLFVFYNGDYENCWAVESGPNGEFSMADHIPDEVYDALIEHYGLPKS